MFENTDEPEVINPPNTKLSQHWLYAAADRIAAGDDEVLVMADFGYDRKGTI